MVYNDRPISVVTCAGFRHVGTKALKRLGSGHYVYRLLGGVRVAEV